MLLFYRNFQSSFAYIPSSFVLKWLNSPRSHELILFEVMFIEVFMSIKLHFSVGQLWMGSRGRFGLWPFWMSPVWHWFLLQVFTSGIISSLQISGYLSPVFAVHKHGYRRASLLWSPYVTGQTIIFLPCGFYYLSFFLVFFPRLISAVGDWMSTILPHMVWP